MYIAVILENYSQANEDVQVINSTNQRTLIGHVIKGLTNHKTKIDFVNLFNQSESSNW